MKHTFIKLDESGKSATIKSASFGGKGDAIAHSEVKKKTSSGDSGNIEMLESFDANKTGCISGDCNNGMGTYSWGKGKQYIGEFKSGQRHGHGTFYFENGDIYVGEWKSNNQTGYGIYEYATKGKYQKYMANGKQAKDKALAS